MTNDINQLKQEITEFEDKQQNNEQSYTQKHPNLAIVYNIFADLLGGVITAFILNKIYVYFFGKNNLVFTMLLIICIIAGLYNTIRYFWKKNNNI